MGRPGNIPFFVLFTLLFGVFPAAGQRNYTSQSVLSVGNWYKIAVPAAGVYKIDLALLAALGVNTGSLASSSVRLFGNGGQMLPEDNKTPVIDDLAETALWAEDGGDGILNGSDYLLFYAPGPHAWLADPAARTFSHQKNVYSEQSFYFISIGGTGKRITTANQPLSPNITINTFSERYFYELDTVNLLSSGRQWFGDDFADAPGKLRSRSFTVRMPGITPEPARLTASCLSRTFGNQGRFNITVNNQAVLSMDIPPVATGPYDQFARIVEASNNFTATQSDLSVRFDYTPGSANAQGWLNWFEVLARRTLAMVGNDQLSFRDWNSAAAGNIGNFTIGGATAATRVWEVTNPQEPVRMTLVPDGAGQHFVNTCNTLREYIAFNTNGLLVPAAIGRVASQNLHTPTLTDYIIVTHTSLWEQAQRLAAFHRQTNGLSVTVVSTEQIFNEFAAGSPDPAAIRNYLKMYHDRAGADTTKRARYLLLLGDASFDYKSRISNNTNLVPAWESPVSLDPLATYTSDDFFGLLDNDDDINGNGIYLLDIGIGRIPARNEQEAKAIIDKIIAYHQPATLGPWRNELSFVADDEDNNLHLQDAEIIAQSATATAPVFNLDKIYLDAYRQESGAGGSRYPGVNLAVNSGFFNGTLIWNYSGHGGYRRLAEEVVLDQDIINTINNPGKLPLFITATCDVAPYDNPLISSIGENLLLREKTGAIALMTTTRLVFAFSNRVMNKNYIETALQQQANGRYLPLGDAVRRAKNVTYTLSGDVINNRKFTLLGDPAMRLAFPQHTVQTTSINNKPVAATPDTLKALSTYSISGLITDAAGNPLPTFNGTLYATVADKAQGVNTLGNDPGSVPTTFQLQKNTLFKGKATVTNGAFTFRFVVPRDISYRFGNGRISYYTDNGNVDGNGAFTNIMVGGSGDSTSDREGPNIKAYLNDERFINGSISNDKPILLVKLADSSGINIMGTGIGHDLVAILDNDQQQRFLLNDFYESELDNYRKGAVRFQLPVLSDGPHTLTIKAWDAANNSSETTLEFKVQNQDQLKLEHVLNYPNPFTTRTTFWFEHNRAGEELYVDVQVFTVTGKLVKNIRRTIFSPGNRSSEVEWDGRDEYGSKIGRGVYIYRLRVQTMDGKTAQKLEKLFIL
ncbi:type IX secretion system sortase PorU [Paraflavitalea sp. CAU 1676]|uniref:type IX secretion system sortase PorU n=1 Tax=Paraflavitalea sp. CAU 1676 TaxID=3032598 RepID=UPI0023DBA0B6|nr:type IX secretion system sortase PorU [Paraflavitalea sp. CAU 1676]MDF2193063.1 type IX secretion system sortase PorU [Paraflavitalea sp. CAU 1676]